MNWGGFGIDSNLAVGQNEHRAGSVSKALHKLVVTGRGPNLMEFFVFSVAYRAIDGRHVVTVQLIQNFQQKFGKQQQRHLGTLAHND